MQLTITQHWFNTLKPRQNGRRFADGTFKCIFLNENVRISIKISLKFVPKGPINNIPALIQIMAWRRPGDKPLSETVMVSLLTHNIYASLGLNELNNDLAPNKRQAIIRTNADLNHWSYMHISGTRGRWVNSYNLTAQILQHFHKILKPVKYCTISIRSTLPDKCPHISICSSL